MEKTVKVYLTGNGGQSHHDMSLNDANKLEKMLDTGSNNKTFKFIDEVTDSKIIIMLDKLFVMEVEKTK